MQILKKWWFYVIVILILVAFFIPKNAGYGRRDGWGDPTWKDKECSCLGFRFESRTFDGPTYYLCSGIPFSCTCFENKVKEESAPAERKEILCN